MKPLLTLSSEFLTSMGVLDWGYTEESVPKTYSHYDEWIKKGLHGPLGYLADERKKTRLDLRHVYPPFKSALVFLFSYQETKKWMLETQRHEVAAYSLGFEGEDYHHVLKRRLEAIFAELLRDYPLLEKFYSLDAQPVMERDLAYRAGLGWFGKNSMLINKKEGSYFIIGSILLNQSFEMLPEVLDVDHCGQCNACVEACPTQAIDGESRTLIANKCLSTFTIEIFKDADPPEGIEKSRGEIFGCDICQDVCPWNKKPLQRVMAKLNLQSQFQFLKEWFYERSKSDLLSFFQEQSNRGLKRKLLGTPFDRPGKVGWIKNLKALLSISK
jgi:epoxyqueuosine reductase